MFAVVKNVELNKVNSWKTVLGDEEITVGVSAAGSSNGYGAIVSMPDKDSRYLLMVINSSDVHPSEVRVKAGNGLNASSFEPKFTLGPASSAVIQIESGCCKYVKDEGEMKSESPSTSIVNKVFVTSSTANVKVRVYHLVM